MLINGHSKANKAVLNSLGAIRSRHLRILIVDDEPLFRRSMSFNLRRKYKAQVKDVGSGMEAVETLKAGETFDLIFLDLMMPSMSGTQTYSVLKKIGARCAIVLMSAHSDWIESAKAELLDVELLPKPIPPELMNQLLLDLPQK